MGTPRFSGIFGAVFYRFTADLLQLFASNPHCCRSFTAAMPQFNQLNPILTTASPQLSVQFRMQLPSIPSPLRWLAAFFVPLWVIQPPATSLPFLGPRPRLPPSKAADAADMPPPPSEKYLAEPRRSLGSRHSNAWPQVWWAAGLWCIVVSGHKPVIGGQLAGREWREYRLNLLFFNRT